MLTWLVSNMGWMLWTIGALFTYGFSKTWMDAETEKSLSQLGILPALLLLVSMVFFGVMCAFFWPYILGLQLKRIYLESHSGEVI